jgi:hypothetical protein
MTDERKLHEFDSKPDRPKLRYRKKPRQKVSRSLRDNYRRARKGLGFSINRSTAMDWERLNKRTTFARKFEKLEDNIKWLWHSALVEFERNPKRRKAAVILLYASKAFGIAPADLFDTQRNAVLSRTRAIITVCIRKAGVGHNETARFMHRDHTTVIHARKTAQHYVENLSHVSEFKNSCSLGPSSEREQGRSIPS